MSQQGETNAGFVTLVNHGNDLDALVHAYPPLSGVQQQIVKQVQGVHDGAAGCMNHVFL